MRNAFSDEITQIASENDKIVLLSGDIGNRLFDRFKTIANGRFFNCGVAEANMISLSSGLAMCGLRPIVYTITPFITARCYEQIKVDLCYHNLPVIIVGTGSGLSYAELGATHQSCDDIAIMRVLPNLKIICPADAIETKSALRSALKQSNPVYIRLGKKGEPIIHKQEPEFCIGKAIVLSEGKDICLLSTGNMMSVVMETANKLTVEGISAKVMSFHTVKPLDYEFLSDIFANFKAVVSVEEHSLIGGFGASIAEWLSDQSFQQKGILIRIGIKDDFFCEAGKQNYARSCFGLTSEDIVKKITQRLAEANK